MIDTTDLKEALRRYAERKAELGKRLVVDERFPFETYEVYERWKPSQVRVLLIGESPPWNHRANYFYNSDFNGGLSSSVFQLLKIKGKTKFDRLREFRNRGYFLIDTIPCIFIKKNMKLNPPIRQHSIPEDLIELGASKYLRGQIEYLSPKSILTVHATAFKGLCSIEPYKSHLPTASSVGIECGKCFQVREKTVIVSVFPCSRNSGYQRDTERAFNKAKMLADHDCCWIQLHLLPRIATLSPLEFKT